MKAPTTQELALLFRHASRANAALAACRKAGVPQDVLEQTRQASQLYNRLYDQARSRFKRTKKATRRTPRKAA